MATLPRADLTPEQYLEIERKSDIKHEYLNGRMWAMAGGSITHMRISDDLIVSLHTALRETGCDYFGSNLRLAVSADGLYTYPDAIVVCGPVQLLNFDTIMNPVVIFEVLSPSTASYDRGEKFRQYRSIATLREYVMLSQDTYLAEKYERQADGRWILSEFIGLDALLTLASVPCTLALRDIDSRVDLRETS